MENYKLFWWRGKHYNFGDEITPWLFKKMCDINQSSPCNIKLEKGPIILAVGGLIWLVVSCLWREWSLIITNSVMSAVGLLGLAYYYLS